MNNIRGFSHSAPARTAPPFREARNAEVPPQVESGGNSFETVLTGVSQDPSDAKVTAKSSRQSPLWPMPGDEQSAKGNGAGPDVVSPEEMLDAAGAAATRGSNAAFPEAEIIARAALLPSGEPGPDTSLPPRKSPAIPSDATSASSQNPALPRGHTGVSSHGPLTGGLTEAPLYEPPAQGVTKPPSYQPPAQGTAPAATGSRMQNRGQESAAASVGPIKAARPAASSAAAPAKLAPSWSNLQQGILQRPAEAATIGAVQDAAEPQSETATRDAAPKGVPNTPLGAVPMQAAAQQEAAIDVAGVTQNTPARPIRPVSPLPQAVVHSGATPSNSAVGAAQSQTRAIGGGGGSRRDLSPTSSTASAGRPQRSRDAQDAPQAPTAPLAGAAAVLPAVVPLAVSDSHRSSTGASRSDDIAPVGATARANLRAPLVEKGPDRSLESSAEDIRPAPISRQSADAGQGGFGNSFEMKANVVSTATHFAPVARLSPVQQIANLVVGALPTLADGSAGSIDAGKAPVAASASSGPALAAAQPSATAVKTLDLQLEPDSLGQVTIRLNLSGGGLDLEVNASRSTTVDLIEKEKQSLSDQLRQSGYSVAGVEVKLGGPAASNFTSGGGANQAMPDNGQATGGSTRGDGSNAHDSSAGAPNQQSPLNPSPQELERLSWPALCSRRSLRLAALARGNRRCSANGK